MISRHFFPGINDPIWCDEMQRKAREIGRALCFLGLFLIAGCSGVGFRQGPPFDLGYTAPKEEPVFIEDVRLDGMPVMPGGILGQDWQKSLGSTIEFCRWRGTP